MARTCGDCYWLESYSGVLRCTKKGRMRRDVDAPTCSNFRPEDVKVCRDCDYFEYGFFGGHGTCNYKGIKRSSDDLACAYFYE